MLIEAGLTESDCLSASGAEWLRFVEIDIYPGMMESLFKKAIKKAEINAELPRMSRMWTELAAVVAEGGPELSGRLSIENIKDEQAKTSYRAVRMRWISDIAEGWTAPALHIDATMRMDLVKAYFPQAELRAEIEVAAPHQTTIQYYDKSFAKSSIIKDGDALARLWVWIKATAIREGGNWLVVVQKDVEKQIKATYPVPDFIDLAHHNDIAGIDRWKNVRGQIIVGRTQPKPIAVANITGALTGEYVPALDTKDGWYPASTTTIRAKDGTLITVETDCHPHRVAEEVRASICEDQLLQISGRGRAVNRTAADPLLTIVLGNIHFTEVEELRSWQGASIEDEMLAAGGVCLENTEDAARAFPTLGSAASIKMKRSRQNIQTVTSTYKNLIIGDRYPLQIAEYQKGGARQKWYSAVFDPRLVPNIEAWLTERLGPLKHCLVAHETEPAVAAIGEKITDIGITDDLDDWEGGTIPAEIAAAVKGNISDQGWTLEEAAIQFDISRPHLSNALLGRFGVRQAAAMKIKGFLRTPPVAPQGSLF